ncbi:hypothetical protein RND71_043919 [Anisodus tanguticus]|uniref:NAD(P)H-quinone oxidoreductase subunit 5, chloroplastic n=1 Tax=Anisodus tanguticus TaxID=243964 RepID=A0AAE1QN17_9SOLA|nr:hypothetical protein RND71_043919 [Anisodus tanguticus]
MTRPFMTIARFEHKTVYSYPYESDNTILFPIFVLGLFTLFVGSIGIPFNQEGVNLDILSKWLAPSINLLHQKSNNSMDWNEFLKDAVLSVSIAYFGIFIASFLYKPIYSSLKNFELINSFVKKGPKRILWDKIINGIYDWSYNRAYIDAFYTRFFVGGIRGLAEFTHFFDRRVIDGMTNGVGVISFIVGEGKGPLNALTPTPDMDRTVSRRSEPSSRTALMGEQPNPWNILQPQVAKSRHRGAKPSRRCELLGKISLLSLE